MANGNFNKDVLPSLPTEKKKNITTGQKAADWVTTFVGSWKFIIGVFVMLFLWMTINGIEFIWHTWDPYPFILLNFVLSCLAAIQAPIILMSQNRTSDRDRLQQRYDYYINRKSEKKIEEIQKELKSIKYYLKKIK